MRLFVAATFSTLLGCDPPSSPDYTRTRTPLGVTDGGPSEGPNEDTGVVPPEDTGSSDTGEQRR